MYFAARRVPLRFSKLARIGRPPRTLLTLAASPALTSCRLACTLLLLVATLSTHALAEPTAGNARSIHTGGTSGAYHLSFCPAMVAALEKAGHKYSCTSSAGSLENMQRVAANPADIGLAQLDVLTLERGSFNQGRAFQTIRSDDVRECIFAVARNSELKSFGDIAARADKLRFILPPETSGSAGTFRYLKSIDSDLAAARSVRHVGDADEAIRLALAADDTVAVFVQFPEPDNPRFQLVNRLGGHFVPMIDRSILSASIEGRSVYTAAETEVMDAGWTEKATRVVTACTPLVVFTGAAGRITDHQEAGAHSDAIARISVIPSEQLHPADGLLASMLKRTREMSAGAVTKLIDVSEAARKKTEPLLEKAREATTKALEGAKPHVDKAKETGAQTLERAKETVKDLIEPAEPAPKPAQ